MSGCTNKEIAQLLHGYELGLLSEDERRQVEQHIIECEHCFNELQATEEASRLMKFDSETRDQLRELSTPQEKATRSWVSRQRFWRIAMPVIVTTAAVLLLVLKDWQIEIRTSEPVVAGENRVAILPFDNLAQPSDSTRLGEIIANLLITDLSQSSSLQVVSNQYLFDLSSQTSNDKEQRSIEQARDIAHRANAKWLVTGAITQTNPQIVFTAQLTDNTTGTVKAGKTIQLKPDENIFAGIDQLSLEIRKSLLQPLAFSQETKRPITEMTTASPDAYALFIKGVDQYRKFYNSEAEKYFRKAISLDSTFVMPYYYLSLIVPGQEGRDFFDFAKRNVNRASARDQFFINSRAARLAGKTQEVLDILIAFVKQYPDEKEPLFQLGAEEYTRGAYEKAIFHLKAALTLDSSYGSALNQLAYTFDRVGDFDNAIKAINHYIVLNPNDANPYDSRGEIYSHNGKLQQSIESYSQALKLVPEFSPSLVSLGMMSIFNQDYRRAESCFVALTKYPSPQVRASGRLYLCYIPAYQGQFSKALNQINDAIHADSGDGYYRGIPTKFNYQAIIHEAIGNYKNAEKSALRSIETGDSVDWGRKIGYLISLNVKRGDIDEANNYFAILRTAVKKSQAFIPTYWRAESMIALSQSKPDTAVKLLEIVSSQTNDFNDYIQLANAYISAKQIEKGIKTFMSLEYFYSVGQMFQTSERVKLHYYFARALEESGSVQKAVIEYKKFLSIWKDADPNIMEIDDAKARLKKLGS
jgi:tetratricopeptide (TPR) repeat protein